MKNLILYTSFALLLSATTAEAQTQLPAAGKPKDFVLPASKKIELPNGLKLTMVPYGNIPKVTVRVVVKTGLVHEAKGETWLARYMGKLMEEGSLQNDLQSLSKKVAAMGGRLSINVGMESISIGGSVLSEYAPEFIRLIAEVLTTPAFPAAAGERLKNDLKRELTVRKGQPDAQAQQEFFSILFKDHPYASQFPTEEGLNALTVEKARDFYNKQFGAQRTSIYVAGNFDAAAVNTAVSQSLGNWAKGPAISYPPVKANKSSELVIIDRPNAPQSTLFLGTPVPDVSSPEFTQMEITNSLLGGSFGSRITRNIREDKGYTYSPYSAVMERQSNAVWYEKADVTSESTGASLFEISKEIRGLQAAPPPAEELKGIQNYEAGSFVLTNSSADGIIEQLNYMDMFGLKETYLTNRIKNLYSVTPAQVQNMARKYLNYEDMTLVIVGDKKQLESQMNTINDTRKKKKAF
ncbi:insulinase family protein [Flavihumibacter rivuli]|uniref:M16 family metallopeptidase n=1 Tax=Flavihumibacter rivuli TaxID=2838156 RepID=UPI001BDE8C19|nr:pitrilysin family protein [Flavihumibacter rivuli]ULQ54939.1 insulinase family protein [Flavihumibacter rivuli]